MSVNWTILGISGVLIGENGQFLLKFWDVNFFS